MEAFLIGLIVVGVLLMAGGFLIGRRRPGAAPARDDLDIQPLITPSAESSMVKPEAEMLGNDAAQDDAATALNAHKSVDDAGSADHPG